MIFDSTVTSVARANIGAILHSIERDHGVRILLAIESGSRAWRFPSADSDYDVRILYLRPTSDYLSIAPKRDVIELPTEHDQTLGTLLDVNGWDIRKAIGLALQSNTTLLEWLCSPIRYISDETATNELFDFVRQAANLDWFAYRYDRPARHALEEILGGESVKLKRYFYALRPALAYTWIREKRQAPPMDLPSLIAGLYIPDIVIAAIDELLKLKASNSESFTVHRNPILDEYLTMLLATKAETPSESSLPDDIMQTANRLFLNLLTAS